MESKVEVCKLSQQNSQPVVMAARRDPWQYVGINMRLPPVFTLSLIGLSDSSGPLNLHVEIFQQALASMNTFSLHLAFPFPKANPHHPLQ